MGNIILTSCGIRNEEFKNKFYEIVPKDELINKKVLYITTAIDGENDDDADWIEEEYKTIIDLGIKEENITEYKIGNELNIDDYDIIYMMGGNTIYLLYMINKYNFKEVIEKALNKGIIYIGSSAGSQVMGTTIEYAVPFNDNDVGMTDFTALNIVDSVIVPHTNKKKEEYINEVKEKTNNKVIFLYDGDGIII